MLSVNLDSGRVQVEQISTPERPEGFALIRLLMGGICNTDLELQRGYYGFSGTPGHEFVGEVVASDSLQLSSANASWARSTSPVPIVRGAGVD